MSKGPKNVRGRRRVIIDGQVVVFESKPDGLWCYPIRSRTHWRAEWKSKRGKRRVESGELTTADMAQVRNYGPHIPGKLP